MPVLTFLLLLGRVEGHILLHLNYEPDFRAVAEITNCQIRNLLDE